MNPPFSVTAFYRFFPVDDEQALRDQLYAYGAELSMIGLVLVAPEGINGTVAGSAEAIRTWKEYIVRIAPETEFKDSICATKPFKHWYVKIREEIVALGKPDVRPNGKHKHLSPAEWNEMIEKEDVILLDTRNAYEVEIGTFKGAIDPKLTQFNEFPEYVKHANIPKEKKVLMFCTGGIRCEKALMEMEKQGYEHVYQLDGGILKYLEEYPQKHFEGECFVFDHRTAVDQHLRDSERYHLCPHCGDPGDQHVDCNLCTTHAVICVRCHKNPHRHTCSKDCAHRIARSTARHAEESQASSLK